MTNKKETIETTSPDVGSTISKTEVYIENNRKILTYIVAGIVIIILGFIGYQKLYVAPLENEAYSQMFMAEAYFEKDSFKLALNGDGYYPGFLSIIDDYGVTKAGNLAKYYAGISYLQLGNFEEAISYLKKFKGKDIIVSSMAKGAMGDAYVELGDYKKAISNYNAAANNKSNDFSTPIFLMKSAYVHEKSGNFSEALKIYERIQKEYPNSVEGRKIEKYITRTKLLAK